MLDILQDVLAPYGLTVEKIDPRRNVFWISGSRGGIQAVAYHEAAENLVNKGFLRRDEFRNCPVLCFRSEEVWDGEISSAALLNTDAVRASGYLPFGTSLQTLDEFAGRLISSFCL